jgi:hypothetical protein
VREISESLRIETTVKGSAYSGRRQPDRGGPQHIRAAAEDELGAGLIRGGRHRAVELDHHAAARNTGRQGVGDRDLLGAPGESEHIVGRQPAHQQRGGGTAHAGVRGRPPGRADVDAVAGHHGFGEAEALLEFAFLVGVQVLTHVRWDDDLDAHQPLALARATSRPAVGRETPSRDAISACVRPSR